MAVSH